MFCDFEDGSATLTLEASSPSISEASGSGWRLSVGVIEAITCSTSPNIPLSTEDIDVRLETGAWLEGIFGMFPCSFRKLRTEALHHAAPPSPQLHRRRVKLGVAEGRSRDDPVEAFNEALALGMVQGHEDEEDELPTVVH